MRRILLDRCLNNGELLLLYPCGYGPIVYWLGHIPLTDESGVRLPVGSHMKIIFLRGSTAVGKTDIAHLLERRIPNSAVIHLDDFGIKTIRDEKSLNLACEKILKKLSLFHKKNKDYVFVEGIVLDKVLFDKLDGFAKENSIPSLWFMIKRSPNKIKLNKKRAVKNSPEELLEIQRKLDELKIENEKIVLNDNSIGETVSFILNTI